MLPGRLLSPYLHAQRSAAKLYHEECCQDVCCHHVYMLKNLQHDQAMREVTRMCVVTISTCSKICSTTGMLPGCVLSPCLHAQRSAAQPECCQDVCCHHVYMLKDLQHNRNVARMSVVTMSTCSKICRKPECWQDVCRHHVHMLKGLQQNMICR